MRQPRPLLIRQANCSRRGIIDILIEDGKIAAIAEQLPEKGNVIQARGGAILPGLHDHHIHLLATAARNLSLDLDGVRSEHVLSEVLSRTVASKEPAEWTRGVNLDAAALHSIDRVWLDRITPDHPVRLKDRTGALWVLNTLALDQLSGLTLPDGFESDTSGKLTGRVWREDSFLGEHIPSLTPCLFALSAELATYGVTGVTDASVTTRQDTADLLANARRRGEFKQRLHLMSSDALDTPDDKTFSISSIKIILDDRNLPSLEAVVEKIQFARASNRSVAVHCVTEAELALAIAAWQQAGALPGDRIEHGSIIPFEYLEIIRDLETTVVTQSGFVWSRGERYLQHVEQSSQDDLYRCKSLIDYNIGVAGSSDAPYGPLDPWVAIRTAADRTTDAGNALGTKESVTPEQALNMYLSMPEVPGGPSRTIDVGSPADLCLLRKPLDAALCDLTSENVSMTIIEGEIVFEQKTGTNQ